MRKYPAFIRNVSSHVRRSWGDRTRRWHIIAAASIVLIGMIVFAFGLQTVEAPAKFVDGALGTDISQGKRSEERKAHPLGGHGLYVSPDSNASRQAEAWRASRPADAARMEQLAALPTARWVGDDEDFESLAKYFAKVRENKKAAVVVLYDIPGRDCGQYSAGGAENVASYRSFVDKVAQALQDTSAMVIIEPDAVAQIKASKPGGGNCLSDKAQSDRNEMLRYAIDTLELLEHVYTYLDAGNSGWGIDADEMSDRLKAAGVRNASGFSLNVSNFRSIGSSSEYGEKISRKLGGKHYVIDTSRNGLGPYDNPAQPEYNWCNPPGRALGHHPTFDTGDSKIDAFLYIKYPGESDGTDPNPQKCFDGPAAGKWWPEYALGLIERWPKEFQP